MGLTIRQRINKHAWERQLKYVTNLLEVYQKRKGIEYWVSFFFGILCLMDREEQLIILRSEVDTVRALLDNLAANDDEGAE